MCLEWCILSWRLDFFILGWITSISYCIRNTYNMVLLLFLLYLKRFDTATLSNEPVNSVSLLLKTKHSFNLTHARNKLTAPHVNAKVSYITLLFILTFMYSYWPPSHIHLFTPHIHQKDAKKLWHPKHVGFTLRL